MSKYYYGTWKFTVYTVEVYASDGRFRSRVKLDSREHSKITDDVESYLKETHIITATDWVLSRKRNYTKHYR